MNWKMVKQISRQTFFALGVFLLILLLPFLLTFFSPAGASSAQHALLTSTDIQAKNLEMRSYLDASAPLIGKVFFNNFVFMGWQYLENLVAVFSADFLFISGVAHGSRWVGEMGVLYLFQFPLIMLGLVSMLRENRRRLPFFLIWAGVTILVLSLSKEVPHATWGYFLVIPLTVFSAQGFLLLVAWLRRIRQSRYRALVAVIIIGLCLYNLVSYFSAFYNRFPRKYAKDWNQQDKALALYLKENEAQYDTILIDHGAGFMYTSLLFYTAADPNDFQKSVKRAPDDAEGFSRVSAFGKYQWREIQWKTDLYRKKTLIVTGFNKAPASARVVKRFRYPQIPIVLSVKEQIAQYPFQEEAYVVIATKPTPAPKLRAQPQPAVGY